MRKQWALIALIAILFGVSLPSINAAQKLGHSTSVSRAARTPILGTVQQFKEAFQNDAGKVRLVALVSPT